MKDPTKEIAYKRSSNPMKSSIALYCVLILLVLSFYGCKDKPAAPPAQPPQKQGNVNTGNQPEATQPEAIVEEASEPEGYVYQQRDRRDPFGPLIVPKKKAVKIEGTRAGSLVSYDIGDFTLAAIAQKGGQYFALLTTPDNRSFTVNKGTAIGLYKGKIQEITKDKIIIIEYSSDYKGELKPRQIILEFHKGEVE
ncbi:MAG: pilus assembly protein PilP [Nitrospirae bacterium]|nr:pilus assembly protein PilP [Nitrospirota bacterium]